MTSYWDPKDELFKAPSPQRLFGPLTHEQRQEFLRRYLAAVRPPRHTFDKQTDSAIDHFLDQCEANGFTLIISKTEAIALCRQPFTVDDEPAERTDDTQNETLGTYIDNGRQGG